MQVWAETLYFYKKDDNGEIIKELKLKKDLEFFNDDVVINNSEFYAVPKKFYVDDEKKAIEADKVLTPEEKHESIVNTYLRGILECIKYHFRNFEIFDDFKFYEKSLANTYKKRLYSRFGKLYKNSELSFNTKKDTEDKDEELLNKANEISINPHTYEIEAGKMVAFFPSNQRRQPATSATPYELINKNDDSFYLHLPQGDIKAAMAAFLRKNKTKINKPIAVVPQD